MSPRRTYIYVDGFNLYYGAVKSTPYKWLDLMAAFKALLHPQNQILAIKYFTAKVNGKIDPDAPTRQDAYIRALEAWIPELSVHYGHFLTHRKYRPLAANPKKFAEVLLTEEKGSDVNLAVHLVNDAWLDLYDAAFVVSNDSDLAQAIALVKHQNKKGVGVITPGKRRVAAELVKYAWPLLRLRAGLMAESQLPDPIPGTTIHKPPAW